MAFAMVSTRYNTHPTKAFFEAWCKECTLHWTGWNSVLPDPGMAEGEKEAIGLYRESPRRDAIHCALMA